ncbi:MAG: CPCC family cysteine-rich protein, partial [Pseudomonadota bacterium]
LFYPCPCCGFPTLPSHDNYEICGICWWEDDGRDDHNAAEIVGGPNQGYSLEAARRNFANHGHMYDDGQGNEVVNSPSPQRLKLLIYVKAVGAGDTTLDETLLQKLLDPA